MKIKIKAASKNICSSILYEESLIYDWLLSNYSKLLQLPPKVLMKGSKILMGALPQPHDHISGTWPLACIYCHVPQSNGRSL